MVLKKISIVCMLITAAIFFNGCILATQLSVLKCPNDGDRLFSKKKHHEYIFYCKTCKQKYEYENHYLHGPSLQKVN